MRYFSIKSNLIEVSFFPQFLIFRKNKFWNKIAVNYIVLMVKFCTCPLKKGKSVFNYEISNVIYLTVILYYINVI